jgi:DSBA-like thioredoxin domain/Aminotransferase class I and II
MPPISFARGIPAPECLPVEELADCARAAIERDGRTVLSYGAGGGYGPLREWLAERHGVEPSRILLTNGSLQGFVFLASRFAGERRFLVEAPTYDRPLKILRELGADVVAVPQDDEGLDVDALEAALDGPALLYTIPTFQNPSGRTLSAERRQRLAELARERDLHRPFHDRVMDAYWQEGRDIGDPGELRSLAAEVGLDGEEVDDVLAGDRYLDAVEASTAQAVSVGVTGVPGFVLDRRLLVLGAQPEELFEQAFARLAEMP